MATSSTRSARKQKPPRGAAATFDETPHVAPALAGLTTFGGDISERTWLIAYFAVLAVALVLRVVALELRPMHHDEGVNGHFLLNLMRNGVFRYDPRNYHGPTLYYFTLPLAYAAERAGSLSTWVVRLVPVVFGMGTVWLGLSLRRYVGAVGALAAGALMAVSPGLVFFSRYFIHEMLFVFFTLGIVVAALRYFETNGHARGKTAGGWGIVRLGRRNAAASGEAAGDRRVTDGGASGERAAGELRAGEGTRGEGTRGEGTRGEGTRGEGTRGEGGGMEGLALGAGVLLASAALVGASLLATYRPAQLKVWLPVTVLCLCGLFLLLWLYDGARALYLVLGAVSAGLLFATKETAFISVGVMLIAWATTEAWIGLSRRLGGARAFTGLMLLGLAALLVLVWETVDPNLLYLLIALVCAPLGLALWVSAVLWNWFVERAGFAGREKSKKKGKEKRAAARDEPAPSDAAGPGLVGRVGGWPRAAFLLAAVVGIFLFVNVVYYSSFFTNKEGVGDALEAYKIWKQTGESGFHGYKWHKYIAWLAVGLKPTARNPDGEIEFGEELPLVALAAAGALVALWKTRRRFPLFAAQWGFGLLAAYSIIPYKTPWLVLSMLVPFALAGGYFIDRLYGRRGAARRVASVGLLGLCLAVMTVQTYNVNFVHYDDDQYPYVYAHTKRSFHELMAQAERVAERAGGRENARFNIAAENQEYWPLPWYVRDWKRIGYVGRVTQTTDDLVLIKETQIPELEATLGGRYRRVGDIYELRPGVKLVLYARSELIQ